MPAPATVDEFMHLAAQGGVLKLDQIRQYLARLDSEGGRPATPDALARKLIDDSLLTHFQAEQLLQGKWRGFQIGKYRVLERLGFGGMGQVFLCEHEKMRRRVAVKVLTASLHDDPSVLERFLREARAAATLDHPNIVKAFDLDEDGKVHYFVMEFVDGPSFYDIVRRSGPLDPVRAAGYIRQAALGLQHAHESGLIHRDIKPSNILVDRGGLVKILDLGLARFKLDAGELTRKYDNDNVLGTADYVAPEQCRDSHAVDTRADIYALGCTFYFLLAGHPPFPEGTVAQKLLWHQNRIPKSLREVRPDLPRGLTIIVEKMMFKDPNLRYQTPIEVAQALAAWADELPAEPNPSELPPLSPRAVRAGQPEPGIPAPAPASPKMLEEVAVASKRSLPKIEPPTLPKVAPLTPGGPGSSRVRVLPPPPPPVVGVVNPFQAPATPNVVVPFDSPPRPPRRTSVATALRAVILIGLVFAFALAAGMGFRYLIKLNG